jgi:integrase
MKNTTTPDLENPKLQSRKLFSELKIGVFQTRQKIQPSGALQVRKQSNGTITFYWRYSIGTKSERVSIGVYDPIASPKSTQRTERGYSLAAAIKAAEIFAIEHNENKEKGGRPAVIAEREANQAALLVERETQSKYSLQRLMSDYADYLEKMGRVSHSEVRSTIKVHVTEAWPEIAALPASKVTDEQIADMMRRTFDAGKGRTANKMRSHLHAAYQVAKSAKTNGRVPVHFKAFQIKFNPATDTQPDCAQNKADKNPLSIEEMQIYWQRIKALPGVKGAVLRLHLLTGGQRIEQLVSVKRERCFENHIVIIDSKGRPGKPAREHKVPLTEYAKKDLWECISEGTFALSTDGGNTHIFATTLSKWAIEAAGDIPNFQAKRIRSGVETLLSKKKVSSEIRGHLQSHGISGVQSRHYDGNDFMDVKLEAQELLFRVLEEKRNQDEKS